MKDWEQFEVAVERFVAALDPRTTVRRNVKLPDRDTGHLRQRDIWIETKICNLFPVKILISCKHWATKLDEGDIDAFVGELRSSGAHKGVIYSAGGYTAPAIHKARALDISCCKLYQTQPGDIPESLMFAFYCCTPQYRIRVEPEGRKAWSDVPLADIFNRPIDVTNDSETLLDELVRKFHAAEAEAVNGAEKGPSHLNPWALSVRLDGSGPLTLILEGRWVIYRARMEAHLLDGSYSFTEQQFVGTQYSPWVDTQSDHPGPHWEQVTNPPEQLSPGVGMIILSSGDLRRGLVENFGTKCVRDLV